MSFLYIPIVVFCLIEHCERAHCEKNVKTKQKTVVFKKYHVNLTGVLGDGGVGGGPEILKYLSFGTSIGLKNKKKSGPRVYLLIPYPPGGWGVPRQYFFLRLRIFF